MSILGLASCLTIGAAVAVVVWWIIAALRADDLEQQDDEWRYDVSRINHLRRMDPIFRVFQKVIQFFAKLNRAALGNRLLEVSRQIQAGGLSRFWLPEEYLGRMQFLALLLLPMYLFVCVSMFGSAGVITGLMSSVMTVWFLRYGLARKARRRLVDIKRRMPFLLDLLTLLMEAGASFLQALKESVREFEGHPIATEFGRVLMDMNMGKARTEAFDNLRRRLSDDEVSSIVASIIQSEELGTPISDIFRSQADVLRVKRTQRAETLAGEAGVNMLLPGVLVMAATVLIILAPFLLEYFGLFQEGG